MATIKAAKGASDIRVREAMAATVDLLEVLEWMSPGQLDKLEALWRSECNRFELPSFCRAQLRALLGSKLLKVGR